MSPPTVQRHSSTGGSTSAEALVSHAHKLLANCGVSISPSKVSRMVREFKHRIEKNGFPFEAFLVNTVQLTAQQRQMMIADPEIARVISYSDPTGESAVNNVLKGRCAPAPCLTARPVQPTLIVEDLIPDPREREDVFATTDGVSDEMFNEVLADARAEGDLSRENVARKCKARSAK